MLAGVPQSTFKLKEISYTCSKEVKQNINNTLGTTQRDSWIFVLLHMLLQNKIIGSVGMCFVFN